MLKKTTKDKEMTLNEVSILENKIKQREQLIKACNEQIAILDEEINIGQNNIESLNSDLSKLQKEYAKMIVFANKNRNHYDRLGFIFASEDFNQAFSRLRYIRQFTDARKVKMDQIAATEKQISSALEASQQAREEQTALLKEEKAQQGALKKEKEELNAQVAKLKKKEGNLQQDTKAPKGHRRHHRRRNQEGQCGSRTQTQGRSQEKRQQRQVNRHHHDQNQGERHGPDAFRKDPVNQLRQQQGQAALACGTRYHFFFIRQTRLLGVEQGHGDQQRH